ncbi:MAG: hypothetical protein ACJ789_01325 [Thermomicrobiales bacterium]
MSSAIELWDLWYPDAAATGLLFARGRLAATDRLLVHAPPPALAVDVRAESGELLAYANRLERTAERPIAFLTRQGRDLFREDRWPEERDLGCLVILPGGEVGKLLAWWNAPDGSQWRWQVEFYNHR